LTNRVPKLIIAEFKMQLALDLPPPRPQYGHGGARPGAGRPKKKRTGPAPLPHVARPKVDKHRPSHVTLKVTRGVPSLRKQLLLNRVRAALRAVRRKAEVEGAPFQIVEFNVEDDHVHLVVEAKSGVGMSRGVAGFAIRVARAVNRVLGRVGKVFADRYHRRDLPTPTEVKNALSYVLNNARKHYRHIGDVAYVDATTSGEGFTGWSEPVERYSSLEDDRVPWTPVKCWTWLLRVGWRRRGLISPLAVPGKKPKPRRELRGRQSHDAARARFGDGGGVLAVR
jgi:REP element-mobilizing transposase RayT